MSDMNEMHDAIVSILEFWFGTADDNGSLQARETWFKRDPDFDRQVEAHLGPWHAQAANGGLDAWAETAEGALALVLLLDQAPRNLFREDPRAFASDAKAREIADGAIARGLDAGLQLVQRMFLYMPFEHSEELVDQERSVQLFTDLGDDNYLDYAHRHFQIVARFGRFPHRNAVLGRVSSDEELAFLEQPGSSF